MSNFPYPSVTLLFHSILSFIELQRCEKSNLPGLTGCFPDSMLKLSTDKGGKYLDRSIIWRKRSRFYEMCKKYEKPVQIRRSRLCHRQSSRAYAGKYPVFQNDLWYAARIEHMIRTGEIRVLEDSPKKYARVICRRHCKML